MFTYGGNQLQTCGVRLGIVLRNITGPHLYDSLQIGTCILKTKAWLMNLPV